MKAPEKNQAFEARIASYREAASSTAMATGDSYQGLRIHAFPGLHAHATSLIADKIAPDAEVLDIAAGSGALSLRLRNAGYRVTACDAVPENFRLHDQIPFVEVNLDEAFAPRFSKRFAAIFALEIIEHIENPRHLMRVCTGMLQLGGLMVISTPNIDNPASIAHYTRYGTFRLFEDRHYQKDGHITPISAWQFQKMAAELRLKLVHIGSYGDAFNEIKGSPRLHFLAKLLQRISTRDANLNGEILCVVLQRDVP